MAINVDQLKAGLSAYHGGLASHVNQLEPDFEDLQRLWLLLGTEYGGESAEEMLANWERTAQWFTEYIQRTRHLARFLEDRITHLNTV